VIPRFGVRAACPLGQGIVGDTGFLVPSTILNRVVLGHKGHEERVGRDESRGPDPNTARLRKVDNPKTL
jgi:hypothetical protein